MHSFRGGGCVDGVDEQIDVFCASDKAVKNHGEATYEDVAGSGVVEGGAEGDEVLDLRRSRVALICAVIHSSASSWLANR